MAPDGRAERWWGGAGAHRHGGAVDLQFFTVRSFTGEVNTHVHHQVKWVKLEDLPEYDFLTADRGLIRDLAAGKLL